MTYADLADRLETGAESRQVTALPDGSVDTFYEVYGDGGDAIESATDFGERIAESASHSFPIAQTARRPGGQSVNMARQADALGDEVTLFGHLDDPVFDDLTVEAHSMGEPSEIRVLDFDDREVLLADNSGSLEEWTLADLETVAADRDAALAASAVCCGNWVSAGGLTEAFRTLAERPVDGGVFALDPGSLPAADRGRVRDLFDALGAFESSYDVVVSVNRAELSYAAESLGVGGDAETDPKGVAAELRAEADLSGAVMHATAEAVGTTPEGTYRVPNLEVPEPTRHTGSGDRFTGALVHALARGWDWEAALALGNLAAAYHVETDETGDRDDLRSFLRSHEAKA